MDFTVWRTGFFGCLALATAIVLVLNPRCGPIRTRVIGSIGFVLVAGWFFLRAKSDTLYGAGMYYPAYRHAALNLRHIGLVIAPAGVTCLLWWLAASLPSGQMALHTQRQVLRWLIIALVSFWLVQVCLIPAHPSLALKITALCIAVVCTSSLVVVLVLYLSAWRRRLTPQEPQVDPGGSSAA
jgi:hypothetical protein